MLLDPQIERTERDGASDEKKGSGASHKKVTPNKLKIPNGSLERAPYVWE